MRRALRSFGPSIASASWAEALRAGVGALVGLAIAGIFALSPAVDAQLGLYLIAPFGASSVLLFAVPNSPLAQPWAAVVGNTVAAVIGVAACLLVADPALRIAVAVGAAITATILCRALHPPAGAVAMTAAMSPDAIADLGFRFAVTPVAAGTLLLVALAAVYARLTGRHYPMRQHDEPNINRTSDPSPSTRIGLSETQLVDLLERYRQNFNLGAEDLARLVGAAELQAAAQRTGPVTAETIMSRDLVTVGPDTPAEEVAALFRRHRFTSIPVVEEGCYLGVIYQIHLIGADSADPADRLMQADVPHASPATTLGALLPLMAEGDVDAVPILEDERITGIVTRTDLISALARHNMPCDIEGALGPCPQT
ncbi:HPP family protein [Paracoccus beibuensis]|uniref:HPP family protein n=1 Tax=Paracoccus beibuensis TaxID=547602 RepID=UPI00223F3035|nr:HPP family protein [Paracoccus beibuensis]